jgi:hypothetical protein
MATVLTGQDLTLTIDGDAFDAQTISTTFTYTPNREVLETLDGPVYKTLTFAYTLDVNMYSDWGATSSLCEALSAAALTAPDTALAFTLVAQGPDTFTTITGSVFPEVPPMSGEGPTASSVSFTLTGDRNVTPTIVPNP